jgi:hypothetical protein
MLVRHGSYNGVKKALGRLVEQGLVLRDEVGGVNLHSLNRRHVAAPVVDALAGLRAEFLRRLRDAIASWELAPVHASMFGSAARGDGDTTSDIDLFIVRPDDVEEEDPHWREQLSRLGEQIFEWTGNRAGPVEVAHADVPRLRKSNSPVWQDLAEDGIDLAGLRLSRLLREES